MLPEDTKGKGCLPRPPDRVTQGLAQESPDLPEVRCISGIMRKYPQVSPRWTRGPVRSGSESLLRVLVELGTGCQLWDGGNSCHVSIYGMGDVPAMSFSEPWDPGFKSPELMTAACIVSVFRGFLFTFINMHVLARLSMFVEIRGLKHN